MCIYLGDLLMMMHHFILGKKGNAKCNELWLKSVKRAGGYILEKRKCWSWPKITQLWNDQEHMTMICIIWKESRVVDDYLGWLLHDECWLYWNKYRPFPFGDVMLSTNDLTFEYILVIHARQYIYEKHLIEMATNYIELMDVCIISSTAEMWEQLVRSPYKDRLWRANRVDSPFYIRFTIRLALVCFSMFFLLLLLYNI